MKLIIKDQKGKIISQLNASQTMFRGNLNHFINIIVNMLENAIKYSEDAPIITISTSNDDKSIKLTINDQGIGMDDTTQKHIFDKLKSRIKGRIISVGRLDMNSEGLLSLIISAFSSSVAGLVTVAL